MKILIAGDFCPQDRVASLFEEGDYEFVLRDVRSVVNKVDYSLVNFECPIINEQVEPIEKVGPNLHCSERGVEALKYLGFTCVTLANNHFRDFGNQGVLNTLHILDKNSIDHVGGGRSIEEASRTFYKEISGKCLAIINCCEHEFSIATKDLAGSNPLDPIQQYYAIQDAKKRADYVLVVVHGGHEHFQLPSPRMKKIYHFFVNAGADAVVNHHQHCYSGYEIYNGKPIFYGLGNFCFDNPAKRNGIWTEGIMVILNFSDTTPSFEVIPYSQCGAKPCLKLLQDQNFNEAIEKINNIIIDDDKLDKSVCKYYSKEDRRYGDIFEPIRNRFFLAAKRYGILPSLISKKKKLLIANYILCESHRDKLFHWCGRR